LTSHLCNWDEAIFDDPLSYFYLQVIVLKAVLN